MNREEDIKRLEGTLEAKGFKAAGALKFDGGKQSFEGVVSDSGGQNLKVEISGEGGHETFKFTFLSSDLAGKTFSAQESDLTEYGTETEGNRTINAKNVFTQKGKTMGGVGRSTGSVGGSGGGSAQYHGGSGGGSAHASGSVGGGSKSDLIRKQTGSADVSEGGPGPEGPAGYKGSKGQAPMPQVSKLQEAPKAPKALQASAPTGQRDEQKTMMEQQRMAQARKQKAANAGVADQPQGQPKQNKEEGSGIGGKALKIALGGGALGGGLIGYMTMLA